MKEYQLMQQYLSTSEKLFFRYIDRLVIDFGWDRIDVEPFFESPSGKEWVCVHSYMKNVNDDAETNIYMRSPVQYNL